MRLITLLLCLAIPSTMYAQWLPEEAFPEGDHLAAFMIDGDTVLAGGDRLFMSSNSGRAWREVMSVPTYFRVKRFERSGSVIVALCDTALWRSFDGGATWSVSLGWGGDGAAQLAVDEAGRLIIATKTAISMSTDKGETWRRTVSTPSLLNPPTALAFVGGRLHIGEINGHHYSTDNGTTWRRSELVGNARLQPTAFVMTADGILHAGTVRGYYFSIDSGTTWTRRSDGDSVAHLVVALAVEGDTIWTANRGFMMSSTDRGATWSYHFDPAQQTIGQLEWREDTLWGATTRHGFAYSIDDGRNWTGLNRGMPEEFRDNGPVFYDYDAFYDYGAFALLTTPVGILRTLDSGRTWTKHDSLFARIDRRLGGEIFDIVRHDDTLYLLIPRGLHYSTDGGVSWTAGELSGAGAGHRFRALEMLGDTLVASGGLFGIVRFVRDDGAWRQIDSTIGVDGAALLVRGDTLFCGGSNGLWRSVDRGEHWLKQTAGLADGLYFREIHIAPSGDIYAWSDVPELPLLWRSADGGEQWESIALPGELDAALPEGAFTIVGETLFIGLNDRLGSTRGVHMSRDRGTTWEKVSTGRLSDANVLAIGRHGDQLLAWTQSYGIWRRSLSELVAKVPIVEAAPARRLHLAPNPASGLVTLQLDDVAMHSIATHSVADVLGRTVLVTRETTFDAGQLSNGLYVVVARDHSGMVVGSAALLVQH